MANGIEKRYSNKTDQNSATIFSNYLSDINDELAQVVIESYDVNTMIEITRNPLIIFTKDHVRFS